MPQTSFAPSSTEKRLPPHPKKIPVSVIPEFLDHFGKTEKQAKFCRDALAFFYSNVVSSEKHLEAIGSLTRSGFTGYKSDSPDCNYGERLSPIKSDLIPGRWRNASASRSPEVRRESKLSESGFAGLKDYRDKKTSEGLFESLVPGLLKNMRDELKVRNYSQRTITNYGASVHQYLIWLKKEPSESDVPEIKKFQIYLKDNKKYSPRTVNLVTAAVQFFYISRCRKTEKEEKRRPKNAA
jgi:hypothetical protein